MNANSKQIGGDHYVSLGQHWDYVEENGLGYLEGCATKYVTRNRKKHDSPLPDLQKALHYVEKLYELHRQGLRFNRKQPCENAMEIEEFIAYNGLTDSEAKIVHALTFWENWRDLRSAIQRLEKMIRKEEKRQK